MFTSQTDLPGLIQENPSYLVYCFLVELLDCLRVEELELLGADDEILDVVILTEDDDFVLDEVGPFTELLEDLLVEELRVTGVFPEVLSSRSVKRCRQLLGKVIAGRGVPVVSGSQ